MPRYPHMLPNEIPLWERWLALHGSEYENFNYDVHVGRGTDPGPTYDQKWRDLAITLTQKRIDATAEKDGVVYIFEVKPDAGLGAVGQLVSYRDLYRREFNYIGSIRLVCITTRVDEDIRYVMVKNGIDIYEVGYV